MLSEVWISVADTFFNFNFIYMTPYNKKTVFLSHFILQSKYPTVLTDLIPVRKVTHLRLWMSFYLACVVAAELMMRHPSHKLLLPETQGRHTALFLTAKMKAK